MAAVAFATPKFSRCLKLEGIGRRFARIDVAFAEIGGMFRLDFWMPGVVIASATTPSRR
jgi:hypothetical protein